MSRETPTQRRRRDERWNATRRGRKDARRAMEDSANPSNPYSSKRTPHQYEAWNKAFVEFKRMDLSFMDR